MFRKHPLVTEKNSKQEIFTTQFLNKILTNVDEGDLEPFQSFKNPDLKDLNLNYKRRELEQTLAHKKRMMDLEFEFAVKRTKSSVVDEMKEVKLSLLSSDELKEKLLTKCLSKNF